MIPTVSQRILGGNIFYASTYEWVTTNSSQLRIRINGSLTVMALKWWWNSFVRIWKLIAPRDSFIKF